jgi:hypothetical protein
MGELQGQKSVGAILKLGTFLHILREEKKKSRDKDKRGSERSGRKKRGLESRANGRGTKRESRKENNRVGETVRVKKGRGA